MTQPSIAFYNRFFDEWPKTATHPVVHLRSNPYDASGRTRYVTEKFFDPLKAG